MLSRRLFPGYLVRVGQRSPFKHAIGGTHTLEGAECVNCKLPLMQFAALDLLDPRIKLDVVKGVEIVPLLYCMRCSLCWYDFVYRMLDESEVEIIRIHQEGTWASWGDEGLPDPLPTRPFDLEAMPEPLELMYDKLNNGEELSVDELAYIQKVTNRVAVRTVSPVNQIGGRSYLMQRLDDPVCTYCSRFGVHNRMYFLASLVNDERVGLKITFPCYQIVFFFCPKCCSLHVQHSC